MNQKSTLIDHLNNEHRYMKYCINDYASKLQHRQELLIKLTQQFQQSFAIEHRQIFTNNYRSIHDHQRQELSQLLNEYEQVRAENHRLKVQSEGNLRKLSLSLPLDPHAIE